MDLIFMDAIVRNAGRYEFNYGFLTNMNKEIKMAPNFDNNISLFSRGIPTILSRKDLLVSEFIDVHLALQKELHYVIPKLINEIINQVYQQTVNEYPVNFNRNILIEFCMNVYKQIENTCS